MTATTAFVTPNVRSVAACEGRCTEVALRGAMIHSTEIGGRLDEELVSPGEWTPAPGIKRSSPPAPDPPVNRDGGDTTMPIGA